MIQNHAAQTLSEQFLQIEGIPPGQVVAGYAAIGNELNPELLMLSLSSRGYKLCLPVMQDEGQPLVFQEYYFGDALDTQNKYMIPQPAADRVVLAPDVLLVPLLGFNADCHRIGYGKGYYDRTLAELRAHKKIIAVGVAYDEQLTEFTPQPHDQRLNYVVTPTRVHYGLAP